MRLSLISEVNRRGFLNMLRGKGQEKPQAAPLQPSPLPPTEEPQVQAGSRRDFFKRTGGTMLGHNPIVKAASALVGANSVFNKMTDEELLETPEQEWVNQISPGRADRIAKKYPEHGNMEAVSKITKILTYGIAKGMGVDRGAAKQLSKYAEATVKEAGQALKAMSTKWRLSETEIVNTAYEQGVLTLKPDSAQEFMSFIKDNAREFHIKLDSTPEQDAETLADAQRQTKDQESRMADRNHKRMKSMENSRSLSNNTDDAAAINRWNNEGGLTFESRLTRVLVLL